MVVSSPAGILSPAPQGGMTEEERERILKMVEEEPWVECEYQQARTGDWDSVCQKLFCNKTNPVTVLNSSTQQYLCDMKDLNEIL